MTLWKKRNIHLAQKGPEHGAEDMCQDRQEKGRYIQPQRGRIKVPMRMELWFFSVQTIMDVVVTMDVSLRRWPTQIAPLMV